MDQNDFLSAVLPTQGKYCTFIQRGNLRKNLFDASLDALYETNIKQSTAGLQTFYALSTFDDEGTRAASHAQFIRALFIDMDCGIEAKTGEPKAFPSKKAAVAALQKFLEDTGLGALGTPWLVDSGGGVHAYWPLDADTAIDTWLPVARAFKIVSKKYGFPIDATVTSDAARVLRMPGTFNWKYTPERPVVLKQRGHTFKLADIADILAPHAALAPALHTSTALALPGTRPGAAKLSPVAQAMAGNSVTKFRIIMAKTAAGNGCSQVLHYVNHAAEDGMEPLWRGMLSLTKACVDGDKAARLLSGMHPYDEDRMLMKLSEIKGPYTCAALDDVNPGVCSTCPNRMKVTTPLMLGRETLTTTEPVQYAAHEEEDDSPTTTLDRPTPPWGFSYGANGGLYYHRIGKTNAKGAKEEDEDVMLLPYDFFMTDIFSDVQPKGVVKVAEFRAIKNGKIYTFAIPLAEATNAPNCIKALAAHSVVATSMGTEAYLANFVRQSVQGFSAVGKEVTIPPRFGWQDGGDFVVGDTVYSQHGPEHDYRFKSDRLHNLMEATRCAGTLEDWRKPFELLRAKGLYGHLAIAGLGFGSIMMHFMPQGSRAVAVHVCSTHSGQGKSYGLTLSNSIWGDPKRYSVPPDTSGTTLMQRAGLLGSLPLSVDEITNKQHETDREFIPKLIFSYAAGVHKLKGSNQGNAEIANDLFWEGFMGMSSNTPAIEAMLGARATSSEGESRRVLEWVIPKSFKLHWENDEERATKELVNSNFGVAGRKFAQWCVTHQEEIQEICDETQAMWLKHAGASDDERFWTGGVAGSIAGYIAAHRAGVISIPIGPLLDFWLDSVVRPTRTAIGANQKSAMDVLNAYIRENNNNIIKVEGTILMSNLGKKFAVTPESSNRIVRGRSERNVSPGFEDLFLEAQVMKRHCADCNFSYSEFVEELRSQGMLTEGRRNLTAGMVGPAVRVWCLRIRRPLANSSAVTP
jgi:hypothetical protein